MKNWPFISRLSYFLLPYTAPILWFPVALNKLIRHYRGNKEKCKARILIIAQNNIAADHSKLVWDLLKHDNNLTFYVTDDQLINRHFSRQELSTKFDIKYIHILRALISYWDLIIFSNHPWGLGMWFAPFIKQVYINHGIHTGKINNELGEDGVYGKSRVNRPYNKPMYDKMFAASEFEKNSAILFNHDLKSRITVTGFLRADLLDQLNNEKRSAIRTKLGFSNNDVVVHIISTWGANSLFQTIGEELLVEAAKLFGKYKFVFSLHPRHDAFGDVKGRKRNDILKKYASLGIIPDSDLSWDEYVVASDIAISDHSSLCLYYVLINKPLILVPVDATSFIQDSTFDRLRTLLPQLEEPERLGDHLRAAVHHGNNARVKEFGSLIREYPGRAAERYKKEIYGILKLCQPES